MSRLGSLLLLMTILFAPGCTESASSPALSSQEAKIRSALEQLPPEDRALAEEQKVCPVTNDPLGSMGVPIKVMVKDQPVFICCKGCKKKVEDEPDETLQKVEALRNRNKAK